MKRALVFALLLQLNPAVAQDTIDSDADCVAAAKLIVAELDEIDANHGIALRRLAQQLRQESRESRGGPYVCQATILMGNRGTLQNIALEYYMD